jgi:hypothetical protein
MAWQNLQQRERKEKERKKERKRPQRHTKTSMTTPLILAERFR